MNAAAKMAGFLLIVVVVFAGSYWVGTAVGPMDETPTTSTTMVTVAPGHGTHSTGGG